jgi:DNA repair protein RecN (Recombination protein N)
MPSVRNKTSVGSRIVRRWDSANKIERTTHPESSQKVCYHATMLRFLGIRNLAVIDHLEIDLTPGLTVLTGETGAGKSMLVEAIDLLTGGRSSADLVRTGEDTATIQAIFDRLGRDVIVRREVSAQGRSRAFIDDALATTVALRELGAGLVDLHGQHEHQSLLDPAEHAGLVDAFANHPALLASVASAHESWRAAASALERTRLSAKEKAARIEWVSFQLHDLDRIAPKPGEDDALIEERQVLGNADRLTRLSTEAFAHLYEGEAAALSSLGIVWKRLSDLAALDSRFASYLEQRAEVQSRLEDLAFMLRDYANDLEASPDRLQQVEDRLAALERLKQKHGPALVEVITKHSALRAELDALQATDEAVAGLEKQAGEAAARFRTVAAKVSAARMASGQKLAKALEVALSQLAMPKSRVEVRIHAHPGDETRWSAAGYDDVEFYLSPNPGEDLRPLARIASGGELSRIMLAIKTLATPDEDGRTLIFDEVDAGIGGAAADAVGARLQDLGRRFQVICITHLPQIAARGDNHLHISKQVKAGRTVTTVTRLSGAEREMEVARMIAGDRVSEKVLASARELLGANRLGESEIKAKGESESRAGAKAKGKRGA